VGKGAFLPVPYRFAGNAIGILWAIKAKFLPWRKQRWGRNYTKGVAMSSLFLELRTAFRRQLQGMKRA
jgi:hypothetical protein